VTLNELRAFSGNNFINHAFVPTLVLANDTGASNSDGITTNGNVNVTVENGATWEFSTNGGANFTTGSGNSFSLSAGSYTAGAIQVRQTGGNAGPTGSMGAVTVDVTSPSVTITAGTPNAATGAITYSFAFAEAMSGFTSSDVSITNGTAGTFTTVNASTYTLIVNPNVGTSPTSLAVSVATNVAQDVAGNPNTSGSATPVTTLYGNGNANVLTSGAGADLVFMGAGADTLDINAVSDSTVASPDRVLDFAGTDKIDFATLLGAGGAGYTNSLQNDTGAGFVEFRNVTLTHPTGSTTRVEFDIHLDAATLNGSVITGAVIDLNYAIGSVATSVVTGATYLDGFGDTQPVWQLIQPSLSGGGANGTISLIASFDAANPVIDVNGNIARIRFNFSTFIDTFALGLDSQAGGGITQFSTANNATVFPDVGVSKIAGLTVGSNNVLEIFTDTGTLGVVGDNQLRMVSTYDAVNNVTRFQMAYDTNASFGATTSSTVVAIDFVGDVTANLIPSHLTFI
jgi:Bacterial Ig-like domain